ncbi:unnamed protein product [Meganyctiphanes norvegica]|uniref:Uncharacterized protein n=1 Tax=Meganyctiphanes norvegica TaxID=48144 RepID=A0AAV2RPP2_MEGNR
MDIWILLIPLLAVSVCADDRWVWSGGHGAQDNNVRTPEIPGRVEPQPRLLQQRFTTTAPDITTFRPSHPISLGRSMNSRPYNSNSFTPFFHPFMPFAGFMGLNRYPVIQQQLQQQQGLLQPPPRPLLSNPPSHALPLPGDGTTKSRVPEDTASDFTGVLEDEEKYTTLDKHQREHKRTQPLPRPREEHLGGLDPREVFYADEDLLIIKGGGFNNDKFEEPSQTLDDSDHDDYEFGEGSRLSPLVLPNPDLEYNGNVPVILPPPSSGPEPIRHTPEQSPLHHTPEQSHFAVFVESPSRTNAMILQIPYVYHSDNQNDVNSVFHHLSSPIREAEFSFNSLDVKQSSVERPVRQSQSEVKRSAEAQELPVLQSLSGDTAVNFLEPRPSINPDAEFFAQEQPHIVLLNQPTSAHQNPQVLYQQPNFVYPYNPVYHYQPLYYQPNPVEIYNRPQTLPRRTRPRI